MTTCAYCETVLDADDDDGVCANRVCRTQYHAENAADNIDA